MHVAERFLRYVSYDTQSSENSATVPTTEKQKVLGAALAQELSELGLHGARIDEYGYVYGALPATPGCEGVPCLGLIAHMDTSPSAPGADIHPRVVHYEGGDIPLSDSVVMRAAEFASLERYVGQDLIVTDGTTLLGADDKAGVAEIFTAVEYLAAHPEIPHGRIAVAITPDEEVGSGADHFDVEGFGAAAAYTVDGGELGELEYENFNAASARVTIRGFNIHPGSAKDKMRNACLMALEFVNMLPPAETPAHTEGYEGFYHLGHMEGDETEARLSFIIRDHDRSRFEERKERMNLIAAYLNGKYGPTTVQVKLKDSYYNMREQIEPHMYLIHRARAAFAKVGVQAREVPIRGGTDGARLSYMGLPCPNLSTGGGPISTGSWNIFQSSPWRRWSRFWWSWSPNRNKNTAVPPVLLQEVRRHFSSGNFIGRAAHPPGGGEGREKVETLVGQVEAIGHINDFKRGPTLFGEICYNNVY